MKAKTIERLLRTSLVYEGRSVLVIPMPREVFDRLVRPRRLRDEVWSVRDAGHRDGALHLLVKVFDREHAHYAARDVRRVLVSLRRAGVPMRVRVKSYRHRERKSEMFDYCGRAR